MSFRTKPNEWNSCGRKAIRAQLELNAHHSLETSHGRNEPLPMRKSHRSEKENNRTVYLFNSKQNEIDGALPFFSLPSVSLSLSRFRFILFFCSIESFVRWHWHTRKKQRIDEYDCYFSALCLFFHSFFVDSMAECECCVRGARTMYVIFI